MYQIKQIALKSGHNFTIYGKLTDTPAELKNCKLGNPSLLFGPLAQYLVSDKRQVLNPCVTYLKSSKLLKVICMFMLIFP